MVWFVYLGAFAQQQSVLYNYSFTPSSTLVGTDSFTINVLGSSINEAAWGVNNNELYAWVWALNGANQDIPFTGNGTWANSNAAQLMTYNAGTDTYSFTYNPSIFQFFNSNNVARVGFLIKARNGTGDKKSQDIVTTLNSFELNLFSHLDGSSISLPSGSNITLRAQNTGGIANYVLTANGTPVSCSNTNTSNFTCTFNNIQETTSFVVSATLNGVTRTRSVTVLITPTTQNVAMPAGLVDGINYSSDHTKATLVLNAPFKDYVYVAGNFNNWAPNAQYLMRKDPASGKFWIEITGLTPEAWYAFQYWVGDETDRPVGSPALVKTADPFSTLVLSPFDDPEIIQLGVYPGLPVYNTIAPGQEREVSVIQTGNNTFRSFQWSDATLNFQKPHFKDLVIYEALVRDFDATRTYQDLINRIDYFKNLNINAIQLMPVMEFEGNMSWGYNTSYHLAIDKRYGPPAKLKEFIDLCHQNGIAVILDVALNHVFGRSPLWRMWMFDANNDGWADDVYPRVPDENPYINPVDMHSFSVGADLNHFREPDNLTNTYSIRTIQHWINEYKIDGYRWDLTKGFTNACPPGPNQEACTGGYHADRVAKLKWYADAQWAADDTSYVIFEHLGGGGSRDEEIEWANYRSGEGKGIMFWNLQTDAYANLVKGNANSINNVTVFGDNNRAIGYAESHDEERVVYKAMNEAGQTNGNLNKTLQRLSAQGAAHLLVPGPKMIWHFGALGWDLSLFTCQNGTVNNPNCKLDTKPQPQWVGNWLGNTNRRKVYDDWSKFNELKQNNAVFRNGTFSWNMLSGGRRARLDVWTSTQPSANLSYVMVVTNFSDNNYDHSGFPYTGTWVNLMDNTTFNVSNTSQTISVEAGGFRVFGNQLPLSTVSENALENVILFPNPANYEFYVTSALSQVEIYNMKGQLVKTFKGNFEANQAYDISTLTGGVYLIKLQDQNGFVKSMKLVVE